MKLDRIGIQGFRSFGLLQELDLTGLRPGLYHVRGTNNVDPDLEGNACGKSSLFEALCWILWERTSLGLRAGNVKNWHSDLPCAGFADFGDTTILRGWQPNVLEVNDRPIDQAALERQLGWTPEAFLRAVYFAQFAKSFVDLRPGEQAELFTDILRLQVWERAAEHCGMSARDCEAKLTALGREGALKIGAAQQLLETDHKAMADRWDKDNAAKVARQAKALETAQRDRDAAAKARQTAQKRAQAFQTARDAVTHAAVACAASGAVLTRLEADIAKLAQKDLTTCPTCGQRVDSSHVRAELKKLRKEHAEKAAEADKLLDEHDALAKQMAAHTDAQVAYGEADRAWTVACAGYTSTDAYLQQLRAEKNPYRAAADAAAARAEQLMQELEAVETKTKQLEAVKAASEYWVKGFKEIRLIQIREALRQLTAEANDALLQLGLRDWAIEFDVERETKSGGVAKGFTVRVLAPGLDKAVPFEVWSGGESQRLRMSIAMGFANLVCSRMGSAPNIEMWDEPSTWLNGRGIEFLLQVLADRAQRLGKIILLADHRALEFGGFAGIINIVREPSGSTIELAV